MRNCFFWGYNKCIFNLIFLVLGVNMRVWGWQTPPLLRGLLPDPDSVRGGLPLARTCFDALHYRLWLDIDTGGRSFSGYCQMRARLLHPSKFIQMDLASGMFIKKIVWKAQSKNLNFRRILDAVYIDLPADIPTNGVFELEIHYQGSPKIAENPPWQGGFVWQTDPLGRLWVSVACQGLGASSWWPCKDHPSDEPDSVDMAFGVDSGLFCVSNGRLIDKKREPNHKIRYYWHVSNPINLYNLTLNIGHYKIIESQYFSNQKKTPLSLHFYVLDYNVNKAKKHFKQVIPMLRIYEKLFGLYPYHQDGYRW